MLGAVDTTTRHASENDCYNYQQKTLEPHAYYTVEDQNKLGKP